MVDAFYSTSRYLDNLLNIDGSKKISCLTSVTVVVFAVICHSFSWLFVILAVYWLTFIGFTPIFGLQVTRRGARFHLL